jgi:hypothetical protein
MQSVAYAECYIKLQSMNVFVKHVNDPVEKNVKHVQHYQM